MMVVTHPTASSFFFSSRRRHTRCGRDWSSDVCSSDLIFGIQSVRRKRNPAEFDLERVAAAAEGYSGAEIDAAVQTAMYAAFSSKQQVSTQGLLDALKATVPLSTTRAEEIQALRKWARTRAVPAATAEGRGQGA